MRRFYGVGTGYGHLMPTYPFLSEDWIAEARKIRAEFPRPPADAAPASVRMNQVITDVPFVSGDLDAHIDTTSGELEIDAGHLDDPDVTVTLDYETAKAVFVDGTMETAMQAFMAGKVRVQGDLPKLIAAVQQQATPLTPEAGEIARRIKEITE